MGKRHLAPLLAVLSALLACLPLSASAANPPYVGTTPGGANSNNLRTPSCACETDDFIILLIAVGGSLASPSVSDTAGTILTDFAFNSASPASFGVYRVHSAADVARVP